MCRVSCVVCVSCVNDYARRYRAIFSEIEMPWNWPADVNQLEAKAYCSWKGEGFRYFSRILYYYLLLLLCFFVFVSFSLFFVFIFE